MQYSGLNYRLFSGLRFELTYPLGRLMEMVPYAVIGLVLAQTSALNRLKRYRWTIPAAASVVIIGCIIPYQESSGIGFGYMGIYDIVMALCVFYLFFCMPMNHGTASANGAHGFITRYTLGIYCVHQLTGKILKALLSETLFTQNSLLLCVLIYVLSFLLSWVIDHIPIRFFRQLIN